MKLKFLGTGTSQGIPVIGCHCEVCQSKDPKDKRFRSSALITTDCEKKILIDCGPDFRQQMLCNNEDHVDAILLTHEHNDHVIGLDDVRPLIFRTGKDMALFCNNRVAKEIKQRFPYAFSADKYPGAPSFELNKIENRPFQLFDSLIVPIEVMHYKISIFGYKFKNTAYITDASYISETEQEKLKNLDYLVLNCIRKTEPHPAHFILPEIIKLNEVLKPKTLLLTHISHHFGLHEAENNSLPENIRIAFDGEEIEI